MNKFDAHILVVDDDDRIRDLIKQYLTENNFLITTANSAEDAKKKVSIIKFDLIILDIMMPGKTGLEFTIENKDNINTPIIKASDFKFSGKGSELVLDMCVKLKADKYIFGEQGVKWYRMIYVLGFILAAIIDTEIIWNIAYVVVALVSIPNLILFLLGAEHSVLRARYKVHCIVPSSHYGMWSKSSW